MDMPAPKRPSFNPVLSPERIALNAERERNRLASIAAIEAARIARGVPTEADIQSAQRDGLALLDKWRAFTCGKPTLIRLCAAPTLTWEEIDKIRADIAWTEREAKALALYVRRQRTKGVNWPDAVVVVGIKLLTALDADRTRERNKRGWGKSTSSGGHWCAAMLEIDRDLAIKHGRSLLTKHLTQLRHIEPAHTRKGA